MSAKVQDWISGFPSILKAGCEIRVGPALGPEEAFVGQALDVEQTLLRPYLRPRELVGDSIIWGRDRVLGVHAIGGGLIDLQRYPKAARHLERFRKRLESRACVKGSGGAGQWYRTIDHVDPTLWARHKILLPEIFRVPRVALDEGGHVPAHSLYAIFSSRWPLPVLRDLLACGVLGAVMDHIAPRIGGGSKRCYKRFLSQLPLPHWDALPEETRQGLAASSTPGDRRRFTERIADIYGVDSAMLWQHATRDWRGSMDRQPLLGDDGGEARDNAFDLVATTQNG